MTDGRSEPKAPLRPIAPPFGGLRSARPLIRGAGTPARPAPAVTPPPAPTPVASLAVSPPPGAPSGAAPNEPALSAPVVPNVDDFLSFVGGAAATVDEEPTPHVRIDEAELAKSTQGDKLLPRTVPAVPETSAADVAPEAAQPSDDEGFDLSGHARVGTVDPASTAADSSATSDVTEPMAHVWSDPTPAWEQVPAVDEDFDLGAPIAPGEAELEDSSVPLRGEWEAEAWPVDEPPPAVATHPTPPHDVPPVQVDDEDPFGWDTPIAYHDQDARATGEQPAIAGAADPFAVLRDVPRYQAEASPAPDAPIAAPVAEPTPEIPTAAGRQGATATVYEPDDAAAWEASAASSSASEHGADAGRRAAAMLAELAEDVRRGRLRVDADANASPAGVLASLLATLLAPSRAE